MSSNRLLLVEGRHDQEAIKALLDRQNPQIPCDYYKEGGIYNNETIYIAKGGGDTQDDGGYEQLRQRLPYWLASSNIKRLGIVVDADASVSNKWVSIRDGVINAGFDGIGRRAKLAPEGVVSRGDVLDREIIIGIWIMPNNQYPIEPTPNQPGILETFLKDLVLPDDILWNYAEQSINNIPAQAIEFTQPKRQKVHLYTWLAWHEKPGASIANAFRSRKFRAHAPLAVAFSDWVRRVFEL